MKKFYLLLLVALASCLSEDGVEIGTSETFIRYFNGGFNDSAVSLAESSDQGYIILANSKLEDDRYKIKLIKTDALGNKVWTRVYPDYIAAKGDPLLSRRGNGLYLIPGGGYVVAGEDIDVSSGKSELYVMLLDNDGNVTAEKQYPSTLSVRGVAISENQTGSSFVILSNIRNSSQDNMVASEINKSDLSVNWSRAYGSGVATNLVNKLFLDSQSKLIWGGTVTRQNGANDVRLVRTIQNSLNTDFDLPIGKPNFNESGEDISRFGYGYAVTGSSDDTATGEREIFVQQLTENGTVIFSKPYPITNSFQGADVAVTGNKTGNAITTTLDGGLFIAGTVPSDDQTGFGNGKSDYYLIKTDGFGNVLWQKPVGSRDEDRSVAVIQASDGNLVLCGNTTLAGLGTVMLMKMDSNGNVK